MAKGLAFIFFQIESLSKQVIQATGLMEISRLHDARSDNSNLQYIIVFFRTKILMIMILYVTGVDMIDFCSPRRHKCTR